MSSSLLFILFQPFQGNFSLLVLFNLLHLLNLILLVDIAPTYRHDSELMTNYMPGLTSIRLAKTCMTAIKNRLK